MQQIVSAACGLWLCLAGPIMAQSSPGVVVELFTSQGCSSCPPADDFLARLAQDPQVIPLSLHVDYWDYIGWEDVFADPRFTDRQKAYARAIGSRTIYTPQMIVDGVDRVEGNQPEQVEHLVRARQARPSPISLDLVRHGDQVAIHAKADQPLPEGVRVQLIRYRPTQTVGIERGENAGMTVVYANIVTQWQPVADWSGAEPLDLTVPAPGTDPVVVILQEAGPGEIVAASRLLASRADGAAGGEEGIAMGGPMRGDNRAAAAPGGRPAGTGEGRGPSRAASPQP